MPQRIVAFGAVTDVRTPRPTISGGLDSGDGTMSPVPPAVDGRRLTGGHAPPIAIVVTVLVPMLVGAPALTRRGSCVSANAWLSSKVQP